MIDGHTSTQDLGSIICKSVIRDETYGMYQFREYYGLSSDLDKLPKYSDMATGSSFYCVDNGALYMYNAVSQTWVLQ